jgi:hypothetical protein
MADEIQARILLTGPSAVVDYGLQKGKGTNYETVLTQSGGKSDLRFDFNIKVKQGVVNHYSFTGPLVQGPANGKFLYIDIGTYAGQKNSVWGRRLKIPLTGITNKMIETLLSQPDKVMEVVVPGTGKDGGPNCGTVKPFGGWKIVSQ